jgi:hypothetical protein
LEGWPIAHLHLNFPDHVESVKVIQAMEAELSAWLARYPIPLQVCAWDPANNAISLNALKGANCLTGYLNADGTVYSTWGDISYESLPQHGLDREKLKDVYADFAYRTSGDIDREITKQYRMVRTVNWFFFVWAVIVPLTIIILGETNKWIARLVLLYSFCRVGVELLKRTGLIKKSKRQLDREKEELEKAHHHYHCKRNPEAFLRLKLENHEREQREGTRKEWDALAEPPSSPSSLPTVPGHHTPAV